jgi:hypothetical protein
MTMTNNATQPKTIPATAPELRRLDGGLEPAIDSNEPRVVVLVLVPVGLGEYVDIETVGTTVDVGGSLGTNAR